MVRTQKIAARLDKMFYKLFANYSLSVVYANILLLFLNIIRAYALPYAEPKVYSTTLLIIERIVTIVCFLILYIICHKCQYRIIILLVNILLPIGAFELNALFLSYGEAYLAYALFTNVFREIIILNLSKKSTYACEAINAVYHIARAIIFKIKIPGYSIFSFLVYALTYLLLNIPVVNNHLLIKQTIQEYDDLRSDFETVISELPIPMLKFTFNPMSIIMFNKEFSSLITSMHLSSENEFIDIIINKTTISQLGENNQSEPFLLIYNNIEYGIKVRKLAQAGDIYIACIQDLSLIQQIESLKAKEIYKQMYISAINHHLRTPINGIYFPLTYIKEICNLEAKEYIDLAINSLDLLVALIDDTIAFSECENGSIALSYNRIDLMDEIVMLKKMFAFESQKKKIPLYIYSKLKSSVVIGDAKKIKQILIILLSNAFKYTSEGHVDVSFSKDIHRLKIEVSDTGIGIKIEDIRNIFKEFSTAEKAIKEKATSSGFQLALVKKLTTLMGGEVNVESQYHKGTKFTILLNVQWVNSQNIVEEQDDLKEREDYFQIHVIPDLQSIPINSTKFLNEVNENKIGPASKMEQRALVVDDNATNVFVLQKMLSVLHVDSDNAMNGLECVSKVSERGMRGYDFIFMDINMPIMNGFEATKAIKKMIYEGKICETPIIAVTAQNESKMESECLLLGIKKCLFKPVKMKEIENLIIEITEKKK